MSENDMSEEQAHRQSITFHKMHGELDKRVTAKVEEVERSLGPLKAAHAQRRTMRDQIKQLFRRVESLELKTATLEGENESLRTLWRQTQGQAG